MKSNLTGKSLDRLKDEYTLALVESMTYEQMRAYLRNIFYHSVALDDADDLAKTIVRKFGQEFYDRLVNALESE